MKIGLVSSYPPLNDSVAKIYSYNIIKNCPVKYIKIGNKGSDADYVLDFESFALKKEIEKIVRKEKIDALHIQYIAPLYGKYSLNLNLLPVYDINVPIVTTLHEVQKNSRDGFVSRIKNIVLRSIQKKIVLKSTKVIVHTDKLKDYLEKEYSTNNIEVIHTGLYPRKNNPKRNKKLVFFGIISPGKGIEYLIDAMKELEEFGLIIAGSTPNQLCRKHLEKIKKRIADNKLQGRIEVKTREWVSDVEKEKIYLKSSIAVLPYTWGPYNSGIVQDAAEYNIPVVITKVGAIYDVVEKYCMGEIVEPRDGRKLAEGVRKAYDNYDSYKKGIEDYRKRANWKMNGKRHKEVYEKALKAK